MKAAALFGGANFRGAGARAFAGCETFLRGAAGWFCRLALPAAQAGVVLLAGFLVLLTSSFKVNVDMGLLTATTYSPRLEQNIGLCLVSRELQPGDTVEIALPDGTQASGELCKLPFI